MFVEPFGSPPSHTSVLPSRHPLTKISARSSVSPATVGRTLAGTALGAIPGPRGVTVTIPSASRTVVSVGVAAVTTILEAVGIDAAATAVPTATTTPAAAPIATTDLPRARTRHLPAGSSTRA